MEEAQWIDECKGISNNFTR